MRNSGFAKALAVVLFVTIPNQGVFSQTTAAPDAATPATPAAPADSTTPPPDAAPATPAAPADQASAVAPNGKKNKKIVGAPDVQAPMGGGNGPIVRDIDIQYIGPKTVAKSVILSNMRTSVGSVYSAASVEEDVRNLYATGFFTNLAIKDEPLGDGVKVNVVVQPKPLVKEIVFRGEQVIKESRLKKEIKSKIGEPLSEQQISADTDKVKDYYLSKGYNQVQVSYKIDTNEEFGRSVITFIISEGERAYVTEVDFTGNTHLTTAELRKIMKTRKKNLLSFLNKSGLFKEDDFKTDLDNLRTYYNSKGYIDMSVKDVKYRVSRAEEPHARHHHGLRRHPVPPSALIDLFDGNTIYHDGRACAFYRGFKVIRMDARAIGLFAPRLTRRTKQGAEQGAALARERYHSGMRDLYGVRGYIDMEPHPRSPSQRGKRQDRHSLPASSSTRSPMSSRSSSRAITAPRTRSSAASWLNKPGEIYDSVQASQSQQVAPRESAVFREGRHLAAGYHRAQPQEHGRHGRGEAHRFNHLRRRLQLGRFACSASSRSLRVTSIIFNFPYFTGGGEKFRVRIQYGIERQDVGNRVQGTVVPRAAPRTGLQSSSIHNADLSLQLL